MTVDRLVVRAFIQARMTSTRFPGKVLAPYSGKPMIAEVISRASQVIPLSHITVATSSHQSDDPVDTYIRGLGASVFRGSLEDVVGRFQACLQEHSCDWLFRLCADSPLLDTELLRTMLSYAGRADLDLVTNTFPRSFPKGKTIEMLRAATFAGLDSGRMSVEQREHVTRFYYDNPDRFRIENVESDGPNLAHVNLSVDTIDDLRRLESISDEDAVALSPALATDSTLE